MNYWRNFWWTLKTMLRGEHDYRCPHGVDLRAPDRCLACERIQREALRRQSDG